MKEQVTRKGETNNEPRLTLEQQRARYAWQCVQNQGGEYTNLAKGAPALIMANGLMQALAFWQDKGKKTSQAHCGMLVQQICVWLKERFPNSFNTGSYEDVMQTLFTSEDRSLYRRATDETLALLRWIRQFAAATGDAD